MTAVSHSGHISNQVSVSGKFDQFTNTPKPPHPVQTHQKILTKNKQVINNVWRDTKLQLLLLTCHTAQMETATKNLVDIIYTQLSKKLELLTDVLDTMT